MIQDHKAIQNFPLKTSAGCKPTVKLLTYNVFLRPPGINNNGNDYKNERCDYIIEELDKFDIACFQELFGFFNLRKMRVQHKAFKRGFIYQATSPSPSFFSGAAVDGGLITLSRYPIVRQAFQEFPYGVLSDNLAHKGILYTKIDINGKILHLFNTHFQASYVGREENVKATVMTRIDQMKCYRKFLNKTLQHPDVSSSDLVLLVGDFNVDALAPGYPARYLELYPEIQNILNLNNNEDSVYYEYESLLNLLSDQYSQEIIDLLRAKYGKSPTTYADTEETPDGTTVPSETCLTSPDDWQSHQCLDYIIQLKLGEPSLQVDKQSLMVEEFRIQNQIFTQLSDHYGVSCEISNIQNKEIIFI